MVEPVVFTKEVQEPYVYQEQIQQ